ncbi:T9SS type A sorting domain-containing protein [Pontibacter sp. Tf4]|uniref:T9SS type A sorting domain-containing protein n=1 Tax=Pontibacter sp. Tf4 TaxID=2761620 RepID=UPI0016273944|nr:T9SS type A sorting domain-containing protein [Pontibacter sp. Tf4]MBB6611284.1 T9SS type A sorting domain-containing protein [Pontibacter sp. Tf4]
MENYNNYSCLLKDKLLTRLQKISVALLALALPFGLQAKEARQAVENCHIIDFNQESTGLITATTTNAGMVDIVGQRRTPDGPIALGNHAAIFDTGQPTGDDTDLYTDDWGNVLIINQDRTNVPNDNQWGGVMELDFSAVGPVTLYSLKALDIDEYEDWSWVKLYDANGNELYSVQLQPLGDNSKQMVDLGGTKGVMKMRVYLDGTGEDFVGSGAIDDIMFCVEVEEPQRCFIADFNQEGTGLIESTMTNAGEIGILGRARTSTGPVALGNHAAIFDSGMPTGDDDDLYTDDWGNVLIINQDRTNVPNDNQWGGILELDFSAFGPVTMYSLKALDIDEYEDWSWVVLYDGAGNELYRVQLQPLGNNSKQMVDLAGTEGVMKMRVYLDGTGEDYVGSGAIDDIMFCVEEKKPETCFIADFNQESTGLLEATTTNAGDIGLLGRRRTADGSIALGNHAAIFDTGMPTGDDTDLYTEDWGNVLIINQDRTGEPNDNQWGGVMELDFSDFGPVTLYSLKALDIDEYEDWSWVKLYDGNGNELYSVQLQPLGNNSKQMVDLGGTSGVMLMKVYLDGTGEDFVGSGAIDDISFCIDGNSASAALQAGNTSELKADPKAAIDATVYPMPFTDRTTLEFTVAESQEYVVQLFDSKGQLVRELKAGNAVAGERVSVEVDGAKLSDGLYFANIVCKSGLQKSVKLLHRK